MSDLQSKVVFPWEVPTLTGPFWDTFDDNHRHRARAFSQIFTSDELDAMSLDAALDQEAKVRQLYHILQDDAATRPMVPAEYLEAEDWRRWTTREWLLCQLGGELGDFDVVERRLNSQMKTYKKRFDSGIDPSLRGPQDLAAIDGMVDMLSRAKRWEEAELFAREALPMIRTHPMLGPNSPQVLGHMRNLMEILARQGKLEEAKQLNEEGYLVIQALAQGQFGKYEQEEIEAMDKVKANLVVWGIPAAA